jgi:hypothetical protein
MDTTRKTNILTQIFHRLLAIDEQRSMSEKLAAALSRADAESVSNEARRRFLRYVYVVAWNAKATIRTVLKT